MEEDLKKALEILRSGGVILYPTDTIWGIGCDATNADAVKRVYEIKRRADNKSMLVLVDSVAMLERYVEEVPDFAYQLLDVAVEPLTLVLDNAKGLPDCLTGENKSIGMRVTAERFSRELCRRFRRPIVSTSANISGMSSAPFFAQISDEIKQKVDYIVNYRRGDTQEHKPSVVMKVAVNGEIKILRG